MNLYQLFKRQVTRQPGAIALIESVSDRHWSYAEIDNACADTAARLQASGLRQGDAVLVLVPMSAALYITLLACFRLGLVAAIIDPGAGRDHIDRCCALYPPRALIGSARAHLLRLWVGSLRRIPLKFSPVTRIPGADSLPLCTSGAATAAIAEVDDTAAALISFTSGSTAVPKAALRSHGFLRAQHRAISNNDRSAEGSSSLTLFPVFVLSNLACGITSILAAVDLRRPERIDIAALAGDIRNYEPDSLGLPPVVVSRITDYCSRRERYFPGAFTLYSGGAPVFPAVLERFRRIAPQARLVSVYGSTEAEPIALSEYPAADDADQGCASPTRGLLAGRPIPEISLRILDDRQGAGHRSMDTATFADLCLGRDQIGEIVVSGDHVLRTYLNGKGDGANKYCVDGTIWHRTGDAGSLDRDGRLWLAGRCQARIEDARGVSYPLGIEAAAQAVGHVERAALVEREGRRVLVVACKQAYRNLVEHGLRAHPVWAGIDRLHFLPRLPVDRRHNSKIDYPRLHRLLD